MNCLCTPSCLNLSSLIEINFKNSVAKSCDDNIHRFSVKVLFFLHSEPAALQRPADGESTVAAARAHAMSGAIPGTQSHKLLSGKI